MVFNCVISHSSINSTLYLLSTPSKLHHDLCFKDYTEHLFILKVWNAKSQKHWIGTSVSLFLEKRISSLHLLTQPVAEDSILQQNHNKHTITADNVII